MNLSGLTGSPSQYCLHLPAQHRCSRFMRVSSCLDSGKSRKLTHLRRSNWVGSIQRCSIWKAPPVLKCAMDSSFGDSKNDSNAIFPRINIRDPYKRLGISSEASDAEIQSARNFLIQRYGGHKPSVDAIESALDKIIMQRLYKRRLPKIDVKKKVREVTQSNIVQAVTSRFTTPSTTFIVKTSLAFVVLGALTVLFPTEEGPTLQVAISLMATIYFIHDRLKRKLRALLYGAGAFIISWLLGTFLTVSVIPPILKGPRSLEVTTSLITYVLLWVSSTYLK